MDHGDVSEGRNGQEFAARRRWPVRFGSACTPSAPVLTARDSAGGLFSRSDTVPPRAA